MTMATSTKLFGINDAKISQLSADTGTSPTYAASIDIQGVTGLKMTPKFVEKQLVGDEQILDFYSKLESIDWSFDHVIMSLDALEVLLGGAVTTTGVTPSTVNTYDLKSTDRANFFKLEGQTTYTDMGDTHMVLWKCKANKVDFELKGGDYASVSASGSAIPTVSDKKILTIIENETATPIA